jgi:pSer/pThr/pTyr-binding forkhead associated (FHA) protein
MAFLVDDRAGEAYEIGRGPLGIGRDPVSHVILLDPAVSRFHAEVRTTTTGYTLVSMGATGTVLNGKPVNSPRLLTEGDEIGIGDHTFRFTRQRPAGDVVVVEPPDVEEDHVPTAAASDAVTRQPTMVNRTIEPDADAPLATSGGQGGERSPLLLVVAATAGATIIAILIVIWRLRHR